VKRRAWVTWSGGQSPVCEDLVRVRWCVWYVKAWTVEEGVDEVCLKIQEEEGE